MHTVWWAVLVKLWQSLVKSKNTMRPPHAGEDLPRRNLRCGQCHLDVSRYHRISRHATRRHSHNLFFLVLTVSPDQQIQAVLQQVGTREALIKLKASWVNIIMQALSVHLADASAKVAATIAYFHIGT